MHHIKRKNNETLKDLDFTADIDFSSTIGSYGAPQVILDNIHKITNVVTYTELLCHYGAIISERFDSLRYLELGCSFGKNFIQVVNYLDGMFVACDIEELNPNLDLEGDNKSRWTWTPSDATWKTYGINQEYFSKCRTIDKDNIWYGRGNLFSPEIYKYFPINGINLVFSDALHDPRALPFEIDNLLVNKLLDEKFLIYYDDLHGNEMVQSFYSCLHKLVDYSDTPVDNRIFNCHGWIGEHEFIHTNGIITNMDVDLEWEKYVH